MLLAGDRACVWWDRSSVRPNAIAQRKQPSSDAISNVAAGVFVGMGQLQERAHVLAQFSANIVRIESAFCLQILVCQPAADASDAPILASGSVKVAPAFCALSHCQPRRLRYADRARAAVEVP